MMRSGCCGRRRRDNLLTLNDNQRSVVRLSSSNATATAAAAATATATATAAFNAQHCNLQNDSFYDPLPNTDEFRSCYSNRLHTL
uniref:Uncharacterized protein n=1 Tax=Syphacia muris TaxID=451379 RepID=A0A0N5AUG9_9BILA